MNTTQTREALYDAAPYAGSAEWDDALAAHEAAVRAEALREAADKIEAGIWPVPALPRVQGSVQALRAHAARIEQEQEARG